jgi:hypothetical protein
MGEFTSSPCFVIKAVSVTGVVLWICPPRLSEYRSFGPRKEAEMFCTRADAHSAIGKLPQAFEHANFAFSVEEAE